MKLKFSPFFLFLILLIVLVISFFLGRNNLGSEGFLSKDGGSPYAGLELVVLEKYSPNNLRLINDQLLFDPKNGNLIEVGASSTKSTTDVGLKEASIGYIFVSKRSGGSNNGYTLTSPDVEIPESKIETIPVSYSQFLYNTKLSAKNDVYVYISWEKDTYLYVDSHQTNNTWIPNYSCYFNGQIPNDEPKRILYVDNQNVFVPNTNYVSDAKDNTVVATVPTPIHDLSANISAYQLCTDLYYYPQNGCILDTKINSIYSLVKTNLAEIKKKIQDVLDLVPDTIVSTNPYTTLSSTATETEKQANKTTKLTFINDVFGKLTIIKTAIERLNELVISIPAHDAIFTAIPIDIILDYKNIISGALLITYNIESLPSSYDAVKSIVDKTKATAILNYNLESDAIYKPIVYDNSGAKLLNDTDENKNKITALFNSTGPAVTEFTDFTSWTKVINQKRVVYMGIGKKRTILVMGLKDTTYSILNCVRYDASGNKVVSPPVTVTTAQPTLESSGNTVSTSSSAGDGIPHTSEYWRDFYQKYWFDQTLNGEYTNEYILKTQVIPPVCPSCPSCPGTGACNTCGGAGGSGTQSGNVNGTTGAAGVGANANYTDMTNGTFKSNADANTIGGATTLQTMAAGNTIQGVVQTGGNTVTGVVGQGVDLAKSTGSGAVDLAKSTGSGAVDLAKSAGSGAVDLLKSAGGAIAGGVGAVGSGIGAVGSGIGNMIGDVSRGGYYNSYGGPAYSAGPNQSVPASTMGNYGPSTYGGVPTTQSGVPGVDNLSYYGALSSTEANFKPITADFSRFGR